MLMTDLQLSLMIVGAGLLVAGLVLAWKGRW